MTKEVDDPEAVVLRKFTDEGFTMVNFFFDCFSNSFQIPEIIFKVSDFNVFLGIFIYL